MSYSEVREHIVDFLRQELVGPDPGHPFTQLNGEEVLRPQDPPRVRYGAGMLFPRQVLVASQEAVGVEEIGPAVRDETEGVGGTHAVVDRAADSSPVGRPDEVPETEQEINRANDYLPSAMGISVLADVSGGLIVRISTARYEARALPEWPRVVREERPAKSGWWRVPIDAAVRLDAAALAGPSNRTKEHEVLVGGLPTGLHVHVLSRPSQASREIQARLITVSLVNRTESSGPRASDGECFFQCHLEVVAADGRACFMEYPERPTSPADDEEASLRLLYRHRPVFAVGHGCAADWRAAPDRRASAVWSESLPTFEVKPILPTDISGLELSMLELSRDSDDAINRCRSLLAAYRNWIEMQERAIDTEDISQDLKDIARMHVRCCYECLTRMEHGLDLLTRDGRVRRAFSLMNEAMLRQQIHYGLSSNAIRRWKSGPESAPEPRFEQPSYEDPARRWRPFQLAFILMTIPSIADPEGPDRDIVDLIWFPTGGGKTEAYLGVSAFCLFLRRLRGPDNGGTAVLMRYTLRLLTTQQFQRAASLICACESLRRDDERALGSDPFTIGLWVGGDVTPNRRSDAVTALQSLLRGEGRNRFVVLSCPWCGAEMGPVRVGKAVKCHGYRKLTNPARIVFRCDDPDCAFSDERGLPLAVVDEDIYSKPPSLVIGTVDKFAMLPWVPDARHLFGLGSNGRHAPPELIIQDELHLISGPLGSMVGHYEAVIEALCTMERAGRRLPPKIIASTATIARADEQVRALYGRTRQQVVLFPPQGLKFGESFFATERDDQPGRLYVGVLATGLPSHVTAQVRIMAALLQSVKLAPTSDPAAVDPYWTLMAYFNSLRELGHGATLIHADITEYLNAMWDRKGLTAALGGPDALARRRFINIDMELTSRIQSGQITEILQELFNKYDGTRNCEAIDVCLATNMIQVGLDVPRLSLMLMVGQPKTTSEYIQASSRVGRLKPGLVVTSYNPSKPRDRSHFEHFRAYHESMYRYVEPTSVTPFSVPVRERALHALVVTLARFWGDDSLRDRPSTPPDAALRKRIRTTILARVASVEPGEHAATASKLDEIFDQWLRFAPSRYGDFGVPTPETPLLFPNGSQPHPQWNGAALPTPSSMRNVDAECEGRVLTLYP